MKYILSFSVIFIALIIAYLYLFDRTLKFRSDIKVSNDSTNSMRVSIHFELNEAADAYIQYWEENNDREVSTSALSPDSLTHTISIVGLVGNTNYKFKVIARNASYKVESEIGTFTTGKPPRGLLRMVWTKEMDTPFKGFILSQRQLRNTDIGYIYLVNAKGETVWYKKIQGIPKLSWWTERNTILALVGNPLHERSAGDHILEFDLDGHELLNLNLSKISKPVEAHHEIQYAPDGSLLTLIYERKSFYLTSKGGKRDQEIKGDAIVRMDTSGNILWKWSVFDVIDPITSTYRFDSLGEWGHANTVLIDRDGNYLISFRDWNEIWKISSSDGSLIWKLGEHGDFKLPKGFSFSGQHAVHINPRGEYMLYDNGVLDRKSKVLAFTLDESLKTVDMKINIALPAILFSEKRGSAYFIDDTHILVCAAEANSVAIIDLDGNVLALAHTGLPDYYRAIFISNFYPPVKYITNDNL